MKLSKGASAFISLGIVTVVLRIIFPVAQYKVGQRRLRVFAFNPFDSAHGHYWPDYTMTVLHVVAIAFVVSLILFLRYSYPNLFTFRIFGQLIGRIGAAIAVTASIVRRFFVRIVVAVAVIAAVIAAYAGVNYLLEKRRIRSELIERVYTTRDLLPERYREVIQLTDEFLDTLSTEEIVNFRSDLYDLRRNLEEAYAYLDSVTYPSLDSISTVTELFSSFMLFQYSTIELMILRPYTVLSRDNDINDSLNVLLSTFDEFYAIWDTLAVRSELLQQVRTEIDRRNLTPGTKEGEFDSSISQKSENDPHWRQWDSLTERYIVTARKFLRIREFLASEIGLSTRLSEQSNRYSDVGKSGVSLTPEEELKLAMDEAIRLVEADSIRALFEEFTPPDDLARIDSAGEFNQVRNQFNIFKRDFVSALQEARITKPEFNDDTTKAIYKVVEVEMPDHQVKFQKIGGRWYFSD